MRRSLLALSAVALLVNLLVAGTANAQYPSAIGALECSTSSLSVPSSSVVTFTATLKDTAGVVIPGQTVSYTAKLNGAVVGQAVGITNANGVTSASLPTGSGAGQVLLTAVSGVFSCNSSILAVAPNSQVSPAISEVEGSVFVPPVTGDAGPMLTKANSDMPILDIAVIVIAGLVALGLLRLHRARPSN